MNKNLSDFVKTASESLLLVLSCPHSKGQIHHYEKCQEYKPFILHRSVSEYCKFEMHMLTNRYGKAQVHPICEKKYDVYQARQEVRK